MGYKILNISPEFREQFDVRPGLEGPFFYDGNIALYYDAREGKYWNPKTDMYLSYEEYEEISKR